MRNNHRIGLGLIVLALVLALVLPVSSSGASCGSALSPDTDSRVYRVTGCEDRISELRLGLGLLALIGVGALLWPAPKDSDRPART